MSRRLTFAVLALGLLAGRARAFDAYNNFGSGDTYETSLGYAAYGPDRSPFTPRISGCRFTALAGGHLAVIRMPLKRNNGVPATDVNLVDIRLHEADAAGNLGPVLAAFTRDPTQGFGSSGAPETIFNSDPAVNLIKNSRYWIVIAPGVSMTQAIWNWNLLPQVADGFVTSTNGGASYSYSIQRLGALRVEVVPEPGDFDVDGDVDGADFLIWQRGNGITDIATILDGDANNDKSVNGLDLAIWRDNFGYPAATSPVPEPATMATLATACGALGMGMRRRNARPEAHPVEMAIGFAAWSTLATAASH